MKTSTIIAGGASTLTIGTAVAVTAENAISNDISKFKGKTFEEVYLGENWNLRFFKVDLPLNIFVGNSSSGKANGLDGGKECNLNDIGNTDNPTKVWLWERTQQELIDFLNKNIDGKYLILVEFNKKQDWFGRSKTHAWFGVPPKNADNGGAIKEKLLKILSSNDGTPTKDSFDFLNSTGDNRSHVASEFYTHEKVLNSPLKLPGIEKSGNCGKLIISKDHKKTI